MFQAGATTRGVIFQSGRAQVVLNVRSKTDPDAPNRSVPATRAAW
jgi:hypothetical protein